MRELRRQFIINTRYHKAGEFQYAKKLTLNC